MGRREVSLAPWMGIPDRSTCSLRGKAGVSLAWEQQGQEEREKPLEL